MIGRPLDDQIVDAGGLISLLLVFVFAYFAALLPVVEDLRHRPTPDVIVDKESLKRRLSSYRLLGFVLLGVIVLVLLILMPLSWHALHAGLRHPFHTLRAALLLVDMLLVLTAIGITIEIVLIWKRKCEIS